MTVVAVLAGLSFFALLVLRRRARRRVLAAPPQVEVPAGLLPVRRRDPEDGQADRGRL